MFAPHTSFAVDFRREVIYQIVTDRFFDGDPANNDPPQSAGLYDPSRTDWRLYWGGDLEGIRQKMEYLACMGVTAIWISPPVDNVNVRIPVGEGLTGAPYHGYQARDYKRVEEHFGDAGNTWVAFDNFVAAAHASGIKVIVDFSPNHTNFNNSGEYGAVYDDGTFLGDYRNDTGGYFHHEKYITDRYGRYNVQYQTLYDLADINQENPVMDAYLKEAARVLQRHGADGFRIDGAKHVTWGWQSSFVNAVNNSGKSFIFSEWYLEDPPPPGWFRAFFRNLFSDAQSQKYFADPLYRDATKLVNRSGMSLLNFPLSAAVRNVFGPADADFSEIDTLIERQALDFPRRDELVNFIDNQDMQRLLSLNSNPRRLHGALAFLLTAPGIPSIYYGTEQYLHDDTQGGGDPYNRPMMNNFSTDTTAYSLIAQLSNLRRTNPALAYGSLVRRHVSDDVYVYERKFSGSVVLVAINKNESCSHHITELRTALPSAAYADYLGGQLGGLPVEVTVGADGENRVAALKLPAHSVGVWSYWESPAGFRVGAIEPAVAQPGGRVIISGENFGTERGAVMFGETPANVVSWNNGEVTVTVPTVADARQQVRLFAASGQASNSVPFTVLTGELIPVTFRVNHAPPLQPGEHIFLAGDGFELGGWNATWDEAVGPLVSPGPPNWFVCAAVPAGHALQFKFVKIRADGGVTWEAGPKRVYMTPASGTAEVQFEWQY